MRHGIHGDVQKSGLKAADKRIVGARNLQSAAALVGNNYRAQLLGILVWAQNNDQLHGDLQVRELQATNEQLSGALSHKTAEADSLRELAEAVQQQQAATLQARKILELSRKVRAMSTAEDGVLCPLHTMAFTSEGHVPVATHTCLQRKADCKCLYVHGHHLFLLIQSIVFFHAGPRSCFSSCWEGRRAWYLQILSNILWQG